MTESSIRTFTPRSSWLHIRLTRPAERTASGLYLPQVREMRATEGKVLATGPGRLLPCGKRAIVWVREGDICLFPESALRRFGPPDEGLVADSDLLATVGPNDRIYPENEWVLIDPDPAPRVSVLGVHLAERTRRAPHSGIIRALGPGELRLTGPLAGMRWSCRAVMNVDLEAAVYWDLIGRRCWWTAIAEAHAGSQVLVRAREILCLEEA